MHGIDGFANRKRRDLLAAAHFSNIAEDTFLCFLDENAVTDERDKKIARLTRQNMLGLLNAVMKAMQERGQWEILKINSAELEQLKEDAKVDIIQNAASRKYHWV